MKIYEKNFDIKVVRARFLTKYRIAPFFFIKIFIKYSSLKLHRLKVLKKKKYSKRITLSINTRNAKRASKFLFHKYELKILTNDSPQFSYASS